MQHMIRTTLSGFLGFIIAVGLFLVMLGFLKPAQLNSIGDETSIDFNFVKTNPENITPDRPEPPILPEMEKTSTPPASPEIDIMDTDGGLERVLPGKVDTKSIELYKDFSRTKLGTPGDQTYSDGGGLKSGIAPFYPPKAMRSQTEGWVEVLIKVGANGRVIGVSVLGAEPRGVFEQATKKAVYKWQFHPKKIDGQFVPYQVVQKIEFTLDQ